VVASPKRLHIWDKEGVWDYDQDARNVGDDGDVDAVLVSQAQRICMLVIV
jgi:hypothetical protein